MQRAGAREQRGRKEASCRATKVDTFAAWESQLAGGGKKGGCLCGEVVCGSVLLGRRAASVRMALAHYSRVVGVSAASNVNFTAGGCTLSGQASPSLPVEERWAPAPADNLGTLGKTL